MQVRHFAPWAVDLAATVARRLVRTGEAIGYIGWTGKGNLGDQAMLEAAATLLPNARIEIFSGARREDLLFQLGLSGKHAFAHIYLGGGTLINPGYLEMVRRALGFGVPVSTLGTGVGSAGFSAPSEEVGAGWREALKAFQQIGVRGPRSLASLQSIGVARAEVVGDLALALAPDARLGTSESRRFLLNAAAPGVDEPAFPVEKVLDHVAAAARRLAELGWRPVPVAFCREDIAPTAKVLRDAGLDGMAIAQPKDAAAFFALACGAGLSIGVRLHCAVLSCCAGVAPLSVAYRDKGLDFADSMHLREWTLAPGDLIGDALAARAETLVGVADSAGIAAHKRALGWREKLRAHVAHA